MSFLGPLLETRTLRAKVIPLWDTEQAFQILLGITILFLAREQDIPIVPVTIIRLGDSGRVISTLPEIAIHLWVLGLVILTVQVVTTHSLVPMPVLEIHQVVITSFLGSLSGLGNTTGSTNTFVGTRAGQANVTGRSNTYMGTKAGYSNQYGVDNVAVGDSAGYNSAVSQNVMIGSKAGYNNTTGINNLFIGNRAGYGSTGSTAYGNVCVGPYTGTSLSSGFFNLILGPYSGGNMTTGSNNTLVGYGTGGNNISGQYNTLVGNASGYNLNSNYNVLVGAQAGFGTTTGQSNIMIGVNAGTNNQTGSNNTFVGTGSGSAGANAGILTNAGAIGANAQVSISNAIVLGNNANVGIGTTAPANKLEIMQGTAGNSGLRFTNLTSGSTATVLNANKFLTVDANGDVVLGSTNSSARVAAAEGAGWEAEGENLKNTNAGGVVIGDVSSTPAGYKLYVAGGVLTEKVKVAVKSTADWSDKVFDPAYRLRSLNEVDRFIQQNKHLPGVASAEEVVKEGVDVGQMQAKLLEKVEELTLYMIDLKKENETLRKKSQRMEKQIKVLNAKTRK